MYSRHLAISINTPLALQTAIDSLSDDSMNQSLFIHTFLELNCQRVDIYNILNLASAIGWQPMLDMLAKTSQQQDEKRANEAAQMLEIMNLISTNELRQNIPLKLEAFDDALSLALYEPDQYQTFISSLNEIESSILFEIVAAQTKATEKQRRLKKIYPDQQELIKMFDELIHRQNLTVFPKLQLIERSLDGAHAISYLDALLTCAQTAHRKVKYDFNPTVIHCFSAFPEYINAIQLMMKKQSLSTIRERFILTGTHWISGEIMIEENGTVKALVIDPVSLEKNSVACYETPKVLSLLRKQFPDIQLYYPSEKRQRDYESCCIFALDDVIHLYTIEQYLPTKNLYDYFDQQHATAIAVHPENNDAKDNAKIQTETVTVIPVKLPLSLMRTTQSTILSQPKIKGDNISPSIIGSRPASEQNEPVNKKGQTALMCAQGIFKKNPKTKLTENTRLEKKYEKMIKGNFMFVATHSFEEICQRMHRHTVDALIARSQCTVAQDDTDVRLALK